MVHRKSEVVYNEWTPSQSDWLRQIFSVFKFVHELMPDTKHEHPAVCPQYSGGSSHVPELLGAECTIMVSTSYRCSPNDSVACRAHELKVEIMLGRPLRRLRHT